MSEVKPYSGERMKRTWTGWVPWFCSVKVTVEADSEAEARELIVAEAMPSLCHQCSKEIEMDDSTGDYDFDVYQGDE